MANFKVKNKKIIPEFVGSLMKAIARRGASKTLKSLERDPVIKKSFDKIRQIDRDLQVHIAKKSKEDPDFKKRFNATKDAIRNL